MISFLYSVRPPVIHLADAPLDADEEAKLAFEEAQLDPDGSLSRAVEKPPAPLRRHNGEIGRAIAEVVFGGVHHMTYATASSISDFEDKIEGIIAAAHEDASRRRDIERATSDQLVRRLAKDLLAHPTFNVGRVSFAKRRFLAGELFPNEDGLVLEQVVELAENMHWPASATGRPGLEHTVDCLDGAGAGADRMASAIRSAADPVRLTGRDA